MSKWCLCGLVLTVWCDGPLHHRDKLVLPTDGGYGFRRPGEGGQIVDVPELLAARGGFAVGHAEESYQQMIEHFEE